MSGRRRERPIKRTNPSGKEVWVARYTGRDGKRRSAGTYGRKHEAQDAIDAAHATEASRRCTSSPPRRGPYEAVIRVISDCGLRLGEELGLERPDFDGEAFHVRGSAHRGVFTPGDQPTTKHVRTIPVPPSTAELVRAMLIRIDTALMFPTPSGEALVGAQLLPRRLVPGAGGVGRDRPGAGAR